MSQLVCYVCCNNCRLVLQRSYFQRSYFVVAKCLYILFPPFYKDDRATATVSSLSPKIFYFFSYKIIYFLRVRALVFIRFGDPFAAHDRNQRVVVSWERSAIRISYPCSGGVFSLRIAFTRFNPGLYLSSLNFFSLCLLYVIMHYSCAVN